MTRRERLMATLRGEPVDRPAVSFYEIGGFKVDPNDPDEFSIYNSPSWRTLLGLAWERTDLIRFGHPKHTPTADNCYGEFFSNETWTEGRSRFSRTTLNVAGRTFTCASRRDAEVDTEWVIEHLLKTPEDLEAYLEIPDEAFAVEVDVSRMVEEEEKLGERGIVMVDTGDPICSAAPLFSMEDFTVIALTEQALFHKLLEKCARRIQPVTDRVAKEFPGHLWRICGPEYATEPYLPPRLFEEYVVRYTQPMVESIEKHGGFARIHCHGRIRSALPFIASMGPSAIDPIEPPPQGDVELDWVRREYGRDLVLFGNLEASDVENMEPSEFELVAAKSLRDGTSGPGRGFVLMPSASPYGRTISAKTMANYETMVRLAEGFGG